MPEYSALCTVFAKLFPAFVGQATVVFTMMHVFCYVGMYVFGGRITEADPMWAEKDFAGNLYYLLNFNTYKEGMVTLFMVRAFPVFLLAGFVGYGFGFHSIRTQT